MTRRTWSDALVVGLLAACAVGALASRALTRTLGATTIVPAPMVAEASSWPAAIEYDARPATFEENVGQVDRRVDFVARGHGYTVFLTRGDAVFSLHASTSLRMTLVGANARATVTGLEELPGKVNYLSGNDPATWRRNIRTYGKVRYHDVYPGVDLVYYGRDGYLEYDFIVAPYADPRRIALTIDGADHVAVDPDGDLVLAAAGEAVLRVRKPVVYQDVDGARRDVGARYTVDSARRVRFDLGPYDVARPLVIDPVFAFSTLFGGTANDAGYSVAVDRSGNVYVTGAVNSPDFPVTRPAQRALAGATDAFVVKLDRTGQVVYSTYLGGTGSDVGYTIAADGAGHAYIAGDTRSADFPVVNGVQPTLGGSADAFVAKLSADGSQIVYSTFFGGASGERAQGMAVDPAGNAYVVGFTNSANFPLVNAFLNVYDRSSPSTGFVFKLNGAGSTVVYSTYLGGKGPAPTIGTAIAVDGEGNAYVTGYTNAPDFPSVNAIQPFGGKNNPLGGQTDVFVTKLNPTGSAVVYSTFLGGAADDEGRGIGVDAQGHAYVTGHAESPTFPTTPGAYRTSCVPRQSQIPIGAVCSGGDAFVAKLSRDGGSLVYSTFTNSNDHEVGQVIAVDVDGNAYVAGLTNSQTFPVVDAPQPRYGGGQFDGFVVKLDPRGASLVFSTYLGGSGRDAAYGIAVDTERNAYVTGFTESADFPSAPAARSASAGGRRAFIVKIADRPAPGR